ncbi:MAG TPA: acetylxylan esterase [Pyrinomonadaceae bacterium]|jgi:dienelactone hydrolase
MLRFALLLALVALSNVAATARTQAGAPAADPFAYDAKLPLDFRDAGAETLPGATVHDVSYASPKGGRVPAYLVVPAGKGPFAAIEFVHWGQGNRTEFLSEALLYARGGAVSLLIDAPHNRPDYERGPSFLDNPQADRDLYVQLVVDARRGLDLLLSRPDVDPKRLAYVGHSLGATWGGALAGVEKRVGAYVLMGGLPNITDFSGDDWISKMVRARYTPQQVEKYAGTVGPVNPENFVGRSAPARLFFQFARWDRYISRAAAGRYEKAAAQPKTARTYDTSHEFNDLRSWCDRTAWLRDELRLSGMPKEPACGSGQ